MEPVTFKHNGINIPVKINYGKAVYTFPDMGLDLLKLFETTEEIIFTIMANDKVMLEIWFHYVADHEVDKAAAIEELEPQEMHQFKNAFWSAVLGFTESSMRPILETYYREIKKGLKQPEKFLRSISSNSLDEQE